MPHAGAWRAGANSPLALTLRGFQVPLQATDAR
jgi:hypothetical protein